MLIPQRAILAALRNFVQDPFVWMGSESPPAALDVPSAWVELVERQYNQQASALIHIWGNTVKELLPDVSAFVMRDVRQAAIMTVPNAPAKLLYVYERKAGELAFYQGGKPIGSGPPAELAHIWLRLPPQLRLFYAHTHDGWTFVPTDANGPMPTWQMRFLSDEFFDLEDTIELGLGLRLSNVLTVFSNAAGDYLCLDVGNLDEKGIARPLIWWHEQPERPTLNVKFWPVLNEWMKINFEDV